MRILVVGAGFVGLTHAVVCAESGHSVLVYDIDADRLAAYQSGAASRIEQFVNEPGLSAAIALRLGKNLHFSGETRNLVEGAEAIFMCVPTPAAHNGATDSSYYRAAGSKLAELLARRRATSKRCVIVNKSTVPIGTARIMQSILAEHGAVNVGVASNPEFLPQGNALESARRPGRVVVGADGEDDFAILRRLYRRFQDHVSVPYMEATPETAEAIKYVANSLLFSYVSFWNGVGARLCESYDNIDIDDLRTAVTSDARISAWGAHTGVGAGGSCFGKDMCSLIHQIESRGGSTELLQAVLRINEYQKGYLIDRAIHEAGFSFNNQIIAFLGLSFKKNTNDMRESSALRAIESLLAKGVREIRAYDPLAMEQAATRWFNPQRNHLFARVTYHGSAAEALSGSNALYIATDHEEFRELTAEIIERVDPPYLILDGRRMLRNPDELVARGIDLLAVGAPLRRRSEQVRQALRITAT